MIALRANCRETDGPGPEDSIDIFVVALENSTVSGIEFDLRDIPRFLFGMALHYGTSIDRIRAR